VDPFGETKAALGTAVPGCQRTLPRARSPGLYADYGNRETWEELRLECADERRCLYVGRAERGLVSRDLQAHFATGRTGSSTVRRSFAAPLRDSLDLRGQPRNVATPQHFASFGLAQPDDQRLTDWMRMHLRLAVWIKPPGVELDRIETDVIRAWRPPLNIAKTPDPQARPNLYARPWQTTQELGLRATNGRLVACGAQSCDLYTREWLTRRTANQLLAIRRYGRPSAGKLAAQMDRHAAPSVGLDRNEVGALLVAAGLGTPGRARVDQPVGDQRVADLRSGRCRHRQAWT
jgi:GIY-YIG catalytic domain-containing protein